MARGLVVLPCYDEARRLPGDELIGFVRAHPEVGFLLVNDGSTDETLRVLQRTEEKEPEHSEMLDLPRYVGKAEAVRRGMVRAFSREPRYCGYFDADLSAPLSEIPRLAECLDAEAEREVVLGLRIALLGKQIARSPLRHYLGRVFATAASNVLNLSVYDTQCGAKLFRAGWHSRRLVDERFVSNWAFDVEILARLITMQRREGGLPPEYTVYELPLRKWVDVPESKVKTVDFPRGLYELARIRSRYLRRRRVERRREYTNA